MDAKIEILFYGERNWLDSMTKGEGKTLVLGFDALTFDYLDEFDLPNFSALRSSGTEAPLQSTHPPWTASAWPSLYTGVDPSYHGVYDFFQHGNGYPDDTSFVTRSDVRAPALWNYLSSEGIPSIVLNMPVSNSADQVNGVLIPGYLSPESASGYPNGIRKEIEEAIGEYRIYSRAETAEDKDEKLAGYLELIDLRRQAAEHLLATVEWEVAIIQVQKTDAVFHQFSNRSAHRQVYSAADELVGSIMDAVDQETNIVVCSDHGIGPVTGYRIYVNEILQQHGFVESTEGGGKVQIGDEKRRMMGEEDEAVPEEENSSPVAQAIGGVASTLDRIGMSPADIYAIAQQLGIAPLLLRALPEDVREGLQNRENVDWRRSMAYCRSRNELGVRINLEGRDPHGIVSKSEYEVVRDEIIEILSTLRTPDGNYAFEFVERREAVYDGPYTEDACDILFRPKEMNNIVELQLTGRKFLPADSFDHKKQGVFIGAGPAFNPEANIQELSITDIAPIIMALSECSVPARMAGKVPEELLRTQPSRREYTDVEFATGNSNEPIDNQMEERLEDLGYL